MIALPRHPAPFLATLLTIALLLQTSLRSVSAQASQWQAPVQLYSSDNRVGDPLLISDNSGRLHLFWNEAPPESLQNQQADSIFYMMKDENGWSTPIDVLAADDGLLDGIRGDADSFGRPHLVAGAVNQYLHYGFAGEPTALSARSWRPPIRLSGLQLGGNLISDDSGKFNIVYGDVEGQIHYLRLSSESVVEAEAVITSLPGGQLLRKPPILLAGADGTLQLTLPAVTPPFNELDAYYMRSEDGGESWSEPLNISVADSEIWSLAEDHAGRLHALFIGRAGIGGRYHRWSSDGGRSWSEPQTISLPSEGTGLSGGDLAVDASGQLHALFGLSEADPYVVAHATWDGFSWSDWQDVGPRLPLGFLEWMDIEVTHGNRLHAIWRDAANGVWYAEGRSDAPEVAPAGNNVVPQGPLEAPTADALSQRPPPEPTIPAAAVDNTPSGPPGTGSAELTILLGVAAALVVIGPVVIWQRARRR